MDYEIFDTTFLKQQKNYINSLTDSEKDILMFYSTSAMFSLRMREIFETGITEAYSTDDGTTFERDYKNNTITDEFIALHYNKLFKALNQTELQNDNDESDESDESDDRKFLKMAVLIQELILNAPTNPKPTILYYGVFNFDFIQENYNHVGFVNTSNNIDDAREHSMDSKFFFLNEDYDQEELKALEGVSRIVEICVPPNIPMLLLNYLDNDLIGNNIVLPSFIDFQRIRPDDENSEIERTLFVNRCPTKLINFEQKANDNEEDVEDQDIEEVYNCHKTYTFETRENFSNLSIKFPCAQDLHYFSHEIATDFPLKITMSVVKLTDVIVLQLRKFPSLKTVVISYASINNKTMNILNSMRERGVEIELTHDPMLINLLDKYDGEDDDDKPVRYYEDDLEIELEDVEDESNLGIRRREDEDEEEYVDRQPQRHQDFQTMRTNNNVATWSDDENEESEDSVEPPSNLLGRRAHLGGLERDKKRSRSDYHIPEPQQSAWFSNDPANINTDDLSDLDLDLDEITERVRNQRIGGSPPPNRYSSPPNRYSSPPNRYSSPPPNRYSSPPINRNLHRHRRRSSRDSSSDSE